MGILTKKVCPRKIIHSVLLRLDRARRNFGIYVFVQVEMKARLDRERLVQKLFEKVLL